MSREYTNLVLEMVEKGILDKDWVILAALRYMSDAQVRDMAEVNGFLPEDPEEEIRSDYQEAMTADKSLI